MINLFSLAGLLTALLCGSFAVICFLSFPKSIYKILGFFNFAVAVWGGGCFLAGIAQTESEALIGWKIGNAGAMFLSIFFYHLISEFCGIKKRAMMIFGYTQAVIFTALILGTDLAISKTRYVYGIYYNEATPLYSLSIVAYFIVVTASFSELIACYFKVTGEKKDQAFKILVGFIIGFIGGSSLLLSCYKIDIIYPFGNFGICIYVVVIIFALVRYQLFDLDVMAQAFQKEKLATMGLLAASVNHALKNPLFAAKGLLEIDIEHEKSSLETSKKVLSHLNRALDVMNKLNRFAKPSERIGSAENSVASIKEAMQIVLELVSSEFKLDQIQIKNEIGPDIPMIQADQRQLEEIFFNLIINACHAMPKGGTLTISASCHSEAKGRRISEQRSFANAQDDHVTITISDTGTGISSDQLKHLFEPFHTTKGEKGTGLGLYITKQIIERNGGKISVKSEEGKGTSFMLEFKKV